MKNIKNFSKFFRNIFFKRMRKGDEDLLHETLHETIRDLKEQLEIERTKTIMFPKQQQAIAVTEEEKLKSELTEAKATIARQQKEIQELKSLVDKLNLQLQNK